MDICGRQIGPEYPPYVVAEISGNHNGSLIKALELIVAAKEAGADAVKIQTFEPEQMSVPGVKVNGRELIDIYRQTHTPKEWHPELFEYARKIGITLFSSPFSLEDVKFLETLGCPAYKIASNEFMDYGLINAVMKTGKPMILSTGCATRQDILDTLNLLNREVILLHCVSEYPATETNIKTITDFIDLGVIPGFSDHSLSLAYLSSVALGGCVVEKHFTLCRDNGPDAKFSVEPAELKIICKQAKEIWESLGSIKYKAKTENIFIRRFYATRDIKGGDQIYGDNVAPFRGPDGIPANENIVGKTAVNDIKRYSPVNYADIR